MLLRGKKHVLVCATEVPHSLLLVFFFRRERQGELGLIEFGIFSLQTKVAQFAPET